VEGPLHTWTWAEFEARTGSAIGCSSWLTIDQPLIDAFATLTGDRFYLHVDPVRAAATPLGGTIAHGLLTLSLLARMSYEVCPYLEGARYPLNYGFNRLRFVAPVPADARVRGHFALRRAQVIKDAQRELHYDVTMEIEGVPRPALVAEWLSRFVM
jgi:acyl dehydratase